MPIGVLNKGGKEGIVRVAQLLGHKTILVDDYNEFKNYSHEYKLVALINDLPDCQNLITYKHPEKAIYIFGDNSEFEVQFRDAMKALDCDRVVIPTTMVKDENACSMVLYDRLVKLGHQ